MSGDYSFLEVAALASGMQKGMARNAREAQATLDNMQARINRLNNEVEKGNQATRYYRTHAQRLEAQLAETQRLLAEKAEERNRDALMAWTRGFKAEAIKTVFEANVLKGKFAGGNVEESLQETDYEISRAFDKLVDAALKSGDIDKDPRVVLKNVWYIPESR